MSKWRKVLLEAKADIAAASKSGKTALHYVANYNGNLDLAKLLLDAEAPVLDEKNKTPLDYAVSKKRTELAELLRKGGKTGKEWRQPRIFSPLRRWVTWRPSRSTLRAART